MKLALLAASSYQAEIREGEETSALPDLRARLGPLCVERYRRVDRFIQLALYGSGLCRAKLPDPDIIDPRTALYLASSRAAMSNTVKVQDQMFVAGHEPKPANFINTLSNSAGYYVARNLQLRGKNIFLSRGNTSFEASLQLAAQDFSSRDSRQILLGAVDECLLPLDAHRQRLGLAPGIALGEGSHWFLLRPAGESSGAAQVPSILGYFEPPEVLLSHSELDHWLSTQALEDVALHCEHPDPQRLRELEQRVGLPGCPPGNGQYGVRSAGIVCSFLQGAEQRAMISISADRSGRFHVFRFQRCGEAVCTELAPDAVSLASTVAPVVPA